MSQIRCVGGYLDNAVVDDRGPTMMAFDYDEYRRCAKLPMGHSDLRKPVKYHTYTKFHGIYLHDEDCCPAKELTDFR